MFPYAAFKLQVSHKEQTSHDDEEYTTPIYDVSQSGHLFPICKKILEIPLSRLEALGEQTVKELLGAEGAQRS
ncbi:MAG: hypothetical protein DSY80_05890 [Desulfocapsa sp.]|nr:MAG: hypothetical protein DSY80_05890 [Desulfocapsa sp.]